MVTEGEGGAGGGGMQRAIARLRRTRATIVLDGEDLELGQRGRKRFGKGATEPVALDVNLGHPLPARLYHRCEPSWAPGPGAAGLAADSIPLAHRDRVVEPVPRAVGPALEARGLGKCDNRRAVGGVVVAPCPAPLNRAGPVGTFCPRESGH